MSTIEAEDNLGGGAFPRNCKSWSCEICAPRKRGRLIQDIAAGCPDRLVTITCREGQFPTPDIAAERLAWALKIVVQRWRRLKPGNQCEYAVVREAQENGWPHLHIAWRGSWIDWGWLRAQMAELINSPHVDVRRIYNPRHAARYIGKYLGKAPHKFGTLKRYWFSKNYRREKLQRDKPVFRASLRWREVQRSLAATIADWQRQNKVIHYLADGAIAWGEYYDRPPPEQRSKPRRLRFVGGFLKYVTKAGVTPVERVDVA